MGTRNERYYYQQGTNTNHFSGSARGFSEQWQAEQYLDEEREHAVAAACRTGRTQVLRVDEYRDGRFLRNVYTEYLHGEKPEALRLDLGDYTAVLTVGLVDGEPAAMSGVWDDRYHGANEAVDTDSLDRINAAYLIEVCAYERSLAPARPRWEGHADRPKLARRLLDRAAGRK